MFGRKKKQTAHESTAASADNDVRGDESVDIPTVRPDRPCDRSEVPDVSGLIDLGSVYAIPGPGMDLKLEVDSKSGDVSAIQIGEDNGAVQIQVFAAPRTRGIWDDIRAEITEMIGGNGGTVDETTGPFGPELRTRLAQPGPQGRTVFAPAIFAGVDGPRWFLRAVYSGAPAIDETTRAAYDECLRQIVISRGPEPRAPRELLPLTMPDTAEDGPLELDSEGEEVSDDLKPFERGPEITEVR